MKDNVELAKELAGILRKVETKSRNVFAVTSWDVGGYFDELYDIKDVIATLLGVDPSEVTRDIVSDYTSGYKDFEDLVSALKEYDRQCENVDGGVM